MKRRARGASSKVDGPPGLRELQLAFATELTDTHRRTTLIPPSLQRYLAGDPVSTTARFNRYKRFHRTRLVGFVVSMFEAVLNILPVRAADELMDGFLSTQRSRSYAMLDYISSFADFVGRSDVARRYPYLADLARLEEAIAFAISAPDGRPRRVRGTKIRIKPHVITTASRWNLFHLWSERSTLKVRAGAHEKFRLERPGYLALVKIDLGVRVVPLDGATRRALRDERFSPEQLDELRRADIVVDG